MLVRILSVIEDGVEKFSTYGTHYAEKVFVGQADLNGTGLYSYCPDHCLPRGRTDSDIYGGWSIVRSWSKLTKLPLLQD